MIKTFAQEFIEQSIYRIEENTKRIEKCLCEITEAETWVFTNDNSNSIGNLILHLCGNIRQYVISAIGKTKDTRERSKEFSTKTGHTKSALLNKLTSTVAEATGIIKNINANRLIKIYSVQGFNLSGM